jgi:hypothetical protein
MMVRGAYAIILGEREASSRAGRAKVLILELEFTGFTCEQFLRKECKVGLWGKGARRNKERTF